jgi:hypothetical protein
MCDLFFAASLRLVDPQPKQGTPARESQKSEKPILSMILYAKNLDLPAQALASDWWNRN